MYHRHADDFPREARDGSYEDRIKQTYPIHPELVRPSLRGLVEPRALSAHARRAAADEHRDPRAVGRGGPVAADHARVDSDRDRGSELRADAVPAGLMEGGHRRRRRRPQRGARRRSTPASRCSGSARSPTPGAHGVLRCRTDDRLGTQGPRDPARVPRDRDAGDVPGNFHSALAALADRATYFYSAGGQYWYDLQANISRRAKDYGRTSARRRGLRRDRSTPEQSGRCRAERSPASTSAPRTRPTSLTSMRRAWSSCTPNSPTSAASATGRDRVRQERHRAPRHGEPNAPQHARVPRR